jgi:ATP-dependent RNA helicase RhlE
MLRKLISKIRQTFTADAKRPETKPTHKSSRPAPKSGPQRHEKRGGHAPRQTAPRPAPAPTKPAAAAHAPRSTHAAKPLPEVPKVDTSFTALGLGDRVAYAVQQKGYENPTPIQAQAIPVVLKRRRCHRLGPDRHRQDRGLRAPRSSSASAPTASSAASSSSPPASSPLQVEEAFREFAKLHRPARDRRLRRRRLRQAARGPAHGMDILIATPGRLLDFLEQGRLRSRTSRSSSSTRWTACSTWASSRCEAASSACAEDAPDPVLHRHAAARDRAARPLGAARPAKIEIGRQRSPAETVRPTRFYPVVQPPEVRAPRSSCWRRPTSTACIIFSRTKHGADRIARKLKAGHTVAVMHSDRSQRERVEALEGFKSGKYEVLVATDIAARGLDIAGVSHVINYDVPENPEDYVHRIGRTGRAQNTGDAFTLVTEEDVRDARSIERYMGVGVERKKLEGFPYTYSGIFDGGGMPQPAPDKPKSRLMRGGRR